MRQASLAIVKYQKNKGFSRKVTSTVGWVKVTRVLRTAEHNFALVSQSLVA
jgi:hypothetical protein